MFTFFLFSIYYYWHYKNNIDHKKTNDVIHEFGCTKINMKLGVEEWVEVKHRRRTAVKKNSVWTARRGKGIGNGENLSSFFFTEFQDSFDAKNMFKVLKEYGLVMEAYIPSRKDKRGKRYNFVCFRKVVDERIVTGN